MSWLASVKTMRPSILPTIHLNGSPKKAMLNDYREAYDRVCAAETALEDIEFNGRDYYTQGPEAFTQARLERGQIAAKLHEVRSYLMYHLEHITNVK